MWYVYVLLCADGSLYTGASDDPKRRFLEHKNGKGAAYTRSHKPLKILHTEKLPDRSAALRREAEIKHWKRARKISELRLHLK